MPPRASSPGLAVAILAAGRGTRFRSQRAKVLHQAGGRTLLDHVVRAARGLSPKAIFVIVGHQAEAVIESLSSERDLRFMHQKKQLGTGHALLTGESVLRRAAPQLLVLSGDAPLLTSDTLAQLVRAHQRTGAVATVLTAEVPDPSGYGRIIRKPSRAGDNSIAAIVEQKSASEEQRRIREINTGIYCFQTRELFAALKRVRLDPIKKEYYLTDVVAVLTAAGHCVIAHQLQDSTEGIGINDRAELARVDSLLRMRKARELMLDGVTIWAPETVRIDLDVTVGSDTEIEPGVILRGNTRIGKDCHVGAYSVIEDSTLADAVVVRPSSVVTESRVAGGARVGPFAHLRPGSDVGSGSQVGAFVEVKKSRLGRSVQAHHLAYLGDASIGDRVNVGAGTITCNYDGVNKHQTVVERGAFLGSGTELVAPVRVGRGAYVAAGSTVTHEVPTDALAIARSRQVNKKGWAAQRRKMRRAK